MKWRILSAVFFCLYFFKSAAVLRYGRVWPASIFNQSEIAHWSIEDSTSRLLHVTYLDTLLARS